MTTTATTTSQIIMFHTGKWYFYTPWTSQPFPRREMACFAIVRATWATGRKVSFFFFESSIRSYWFKPKIVGSPFAMQKSWNDQEIITETRGEIFWWRSQCLRRCPCFISLLPHLKITENATITGSFKDNESVIWNRIWRFCNDDPINPSHYARKIRSCYHVMTLMKAVWSLEENRTCKASKPSLFYH